MTDPSKTRDTTLEIHRHPHPKLRPLVSALESAGVATTFSGDGHGDKVIFVDLAPEHAHGLPPAGPCGWGVVYLDMAQATAFAEGRQEPLTMDMDEIADFVRRTARPEVTDSNIQQGIQFERSRRWRMLNEGPRRLARGAGPISEEEARAVAEWVIGNRRAGGLKKTAAGDSAKG